MAGNVHRLERLRSQDKPRSHKFGYIDVEIIPKIGHQHKVTNITMSPTSLSLIIPHHLLLRTLQCC